MRFSKFWCTIALAGAVAFGASQAGAQQPPYVPKPTPNAAGGLGHTTLAAVVAADGTHVAGTGGLGLLSTSRLGTGDYEVIFKRNQDRCFPTASITDRAATATTHGFITVVRRACNDDGYFVETFSDTNVPADRAFSLIVFCNS